MSTLDLEEWRPIAGWEGLYDISSHGRIRSYFGPKGSPRVMNPCPNKHGYLFVTLTHRPSGKYRSVAVHILVADAFLPIDLERPEVNHIDANKANPRLDNLERVNRDENMAHAYALGRKGGQPREKRRLTFESAVDAHLLIFEGIKLRKIAAAFECSEGLLRGMRLRQSWKDAYDAAQALWLRCDPRCATVQDLLQQPVEGDKP